MTPTSHIEIPDDHRGLYRLFEILPGTISWLLLILPLIFSFRYPLAVSSVLILYTLFWLIRAIRMNARLIAGYLRYRTAIKRDWLVECESLPAELGWNELRQVVIMTWYNEDKSILKASIQSLIQSHYPLKRIFFVLAVEERGGPAVRQAAEELKQEFKGQFGDFMIALHPGDIAGEVRGKGANITYAAKLVRTELDQKGIDYEQAVVTTLDADNRVHPKYLANLAFMFLTDVDPLHHSYQPIPMFFNNIWDVPLPIRSISVGSSFWQLTESMRPHRLRNFSSHAQGFAALVATDFWSVHTIVEDGHQYWRTFFRFNGRHSVVPLYVPIYQDAVLSPKGYLASFQEQYLQKRRWAWGVSDVPYVFTRLLRRRTFSVDAWIQAFRLLEGHVSWATTSLMLAVVGWAPIYLNRSFRATVLAVNYPLLYERILQTAAFGLVISFMVSLLMLPPFPKGRKKVSLSFILEWSTAPFLLPITNVLFGALPSLESQTRLMFGKYLGFHVTEKAAQRHEQESLVAKH